MSLCLHFAAPLLLAVTSKHFLELFKNVATKASAAPLLLPKLILEALEPCKSLASSSVKRVLPAEGVLLLFISRHSSLIVNGPFVAIAEGLVSIVNVREPLLGDLSFVDVRMVLLGQLEISSLELSLSGIARNAQLIVEVVPCAEHL